MNYLYTFEILQRITDRARIGQSLSEIAIELNLEFPLFLEDYQAVDSQVYIAYNRGIAQGVQSVREKTYTLAKGGSSQASKDYEQYIKAQARRDFLQKQRDL